MKLISLPANQQQNQESLRNRGISRSFRYSAQRDYTTFIMADSARVLDRIAWKRGQKGHTIASRPSSFAMASTSNSSNPKFLTENDIPGASLLGRKPEELKISELKFWHKCRGDAGIRLTIKAEPVKQVHDYKRPWFLGRTRAETAFLLL